jgi:hypothetical protein
MATTVFYNGVLIHNALTRRWVENVVYDPSDTDVVHHDFDLEFEGLVYLAGPSTMATRAPAWVAATMSQYFPGTGNVTLVAWELPTIRSYLEQARGVLIVQTGDFEDDTATNLLTCVPTIPPSAVPPVALDMGTVLNPDRDVKNGPHPTQFKVLQIIGGRAARVAFSIRCAKVNCLRATGFPAVPLVLNNRWSVQEAMDVNAQVTRTISGRMRLSMPVSALAMDYKWLCTPGIEPGFRRESIDFLVDPTGLECEYHVVDRQVYAAAPWPATKMNIEQTEEMQEATQFFTTVNVRLEAPVNASKGLLFLRILYTWQARAAFLKLFNQNAQEPAQNPYFIEGFRIVDHVGEVNAMEGMIRIRHQPSQVSSNLQVSWQELMKRIVPGFRPLHYDTPLDGEPRPYDPRLSDPPPLYGYNPYDPAVRTPAILMLLQCYLQTPCTVMPRWIAQGGQAPSPENPPQYETMVRGTQSETELTSPGQKSDYSLAAMQNVFTIARMKNHYETDRCRVQLPIAGRAAAGEDTSLVVSLAPPQARRVLEFDIERAGSWPEIPEPTDMYQDGQLVGRLLEKAIDPHPPMTADGQNRIYRISGSYTWALSRPPQSGDKITTGLLPYTNFTPAETAVDLGTLEMRALGGTQGDFTLIPQQ